jgi:hypothetical protein
MESHVLSGQSMIDLPDHRWRTPVVKHRRKHPLASEKKTRHLGQVATPDLIASLMARWVMSKNQAH